MGLFSDIRALFRQGSHVYHALREGRAEMRALRSQLDAIREDTEANELAQLHRASGSAITVWAIMEERIVMVACLLLQTTPEKTGLIFYSIINFQAWITITTDLFSLEPMFADFQKRWNKIFERLRAEKDNRDRLAHNYASAADVSDNPIKRAAKLPSRIDMRPKSRALSPMTVEQINDFADRIGAISDDLLRLVDDMIHHRDKLQSQPSTDKSSARGPGPPT